MKLRWRSQLLQGNEIYLMKIDYLLLALDHDVFLFFFQILELGDNGSLKLGAVEVDAVPSIGFSDLVLALSRPRSQFKGIRSLLLGICDIF